MNIAIIGARRTRNGIGEHIGKFFQQNSAQVVGVLCTTAESAAHASRALHSYGISARPYHDFSEMISTESLDAVAIASPMETHREYLLQAIENRLSVFCEKPFLDPASDDVEKDLESIFGLAGEKGVTVAMNSQWPFCLTAYRDLCGITAPADIASFSIGLSPMCQGSNMIPDSVPHGLSLLHAALGQGTVEDLAFGGGSTDMTVAFTYASRYGGVKASFTLRQTSSQPRPFSFGFNGRVAERSIDMSTYSISFAFKGKQVRVPDPLELSVRDFIQAISLGRPPLVGREHIIATTLLLKQIYDAYIHQARKKWKN